jgi:hypothetical protein
LRGDAVGFILVHLILWFNDIIERLDIPGVNEPVDDGGYNHRYIAGTRVWSKHARAAAADLNWQRHPSGVSTAHSFTKKQIRRIHRHYRRINLMAGGKLLEWGGDWPSHAGSTAPTDSMHHQVNRLSNRAIHRVALALANTKRGTKIIKANPDHHNFKRVHI